MNGSTKIDILKLRNNRFHVNIGNSSLKNRQYISLLKYLHAQYVYGFL